MAVQPLTVRAHTGTLSVEGLGAVRSAMLADVAHVAGAVVSHLTPVGAVQTAVDLLLLAARSLPQVIIESVVVA